MTTCSCASPLRRSAPKGTMGASAFDRCGRCDGSITPIAVRMKELTMPAIPMIPDRQDPYLEDRRS